MFLGFLAAAVGCTQPMVRPPTPAKDLDPYAEWEPLPGERFYIALFASQSTPKLARLNHSWGTIIRVVEQAEGQPAMVETHTISWMPATLRIRPWHFRPEDGVNLSLDETLQYAVSIGERVSMWGPYECRPNLYRRFIVQKEFLESGQILYQSIDSAGKSARAGNACNCIHALTDMDPQFARRRYSIFRFGDAATRFIVQQCRKRGVLINPDQTHPEIEAYLGLGAYPIVRRR